MECTSKNTRRAASPCCGEKKARTDDCGPKAIDFQPFPTDRPFLKNFNIAPERLQRIAARVPDVEVYSYVLTTATWDAPHTGKVTQRGSAPNFQGGRITLCTCKYAMRAGRRRHLWPGTWVAGFCSGAKRQAYGLFYLMRITEAFESHGDLWNALTRAERMERSMARTSHGDLMEPKTASFEKDRFNIKNYLRVLKTHVHTTPKYPDQYLRDFDFREYDRHKRIAPLLLGEKENSFLWSRPRFEFRGKHPRTKKFHSLANLVQHLKIIP